MGRGPTMAPQLLEAPGIPMKFLNVRDVMPLSWPISTDGMMAVRDSAMTAIGWRI